MSLLTYCAAIDSLHGNVEVTSREQILEIRRTDRLPESAMLYVVMRKLAAGDFKIPMQGVYGGTVSKQAQSAWRQLR